MRSSITQNVQTNERARLNYELHNTWVPNLEFGRLFRFCFFSLCIEIRIDVYLWNNLYNRYCTGKKTFQGCLIRTIYVTFTENQPKLLKTRSMMKVLDLPAPNINSVSMLQSNVQECNCRIDWQRITAVIGDGLTLYIPH